MTFLSSLQGTISLDGHDIRQLNPVWLRSRIGTVSQVGREASVFIILPLKFDFIIYCSLDLNLLKEKGWKLSRCTKLISNGMFFKVCK